MKLAIMQPYLFPYVGYYQLVAAVDRFVFLDDVAYMKGGWINRNRLRVSGDIRYFTVPLAGASPHRRIDELLVESNGHWRRKMLASVAQSYSSAPHFDSTFAILKEVLCTSGDSITALAKNSVILVARHIGLTPSFVLGPEIYGNAGLHGAERVIDICRKEGAETYVNLPGGRLLYDPDVFAKQGVRLEFIDPNLAPYTSTTPDFVPRLSILDAMMFNDAEWIRSFITMGTRA